jgi:hypothetical protein
MATPTEDEAVRLICKLLDEDETMVLRMRRGDFEMEAGRELTDEEWERVISTSGFSEGLSRDELLDVAWMIVASILEEADIT